MSAAFWFRAGSALMFLAVAAGAFGAHALKARLTPERLAVFETAVRYQAYHALALLAVWAAARGGASRPLSAAGWCFLLGIWFFSGSLYALCLTDIKLFGAVTPVGGLLFLIGWACLAAAPLP